MFIATQLNSTELNSTAATTVDSVCRSWRHKQKHDWLGCTLLNWVSWVELCRYKHPFNGTVADWYLWQASEAIFRLVFTNLGNGRMKGRTTWERNLSACLALLDVVFVGQISWTHQRSAWRNRSTQITWLRYWRTKSTTTKINTKTKPNKTKLDPT